MTKKSIFIAALFALVLGACHTPYHMSDISRTRLLIDNRYDATPDADVMAFIAPYKQKVDSTMSPVVGHAASYLEPKRPEGKLSNLMPDILLWGSKKFNETPDFAVYNMGGIRASFAEGVVTYGDVINVAPFENKICFLTMTGEKVVKVFCHEQQAIREFDQLNEELYQSAAKANGFANIIGPVNGQLGNTNYVICAIVGGILAINHYAGFTVGALASFLTLNRGFSMPINQVSMQFNSIIMALAGAERIFNLMDAEPETDDGYVMLVNCQRGPDGEIHETREHTGQWAWKHYHKAEDTTTYQALEGDITFNGVDFGYRDDKIVLHDIWIHAKPGMKIALVGSTGAGKTTITNLINRFYDIQDGKIRYDNINVNKIKKGDLRRSLGIVLQDTHLFSGTVRENIRYGKLDASDEEVVRAAKLANADGFIRRLPQGYETMLTGDGANLSQGQRQLLAIARAAIADPPALILDEATSSIDTRTEKIVQAGMDSLMKGRTTFVIAHRLSTIRNSDLIIVLEQGRIVEQGTHDELIELGQRYYQLYTGKKPELAG